MENGEFSKEEDCANFLGMNQIQEIFGKDDYSYFMYYLENILKNNEREIKLLALVKSEEGIDYIEMMKVISTALSKMEDIAPLFRDRRAIPLIHKWPVGENDDPTNPEWRTKAYMEAYIRRTNKLEQKGT